MIHRRGRRVRGQADDNETVCRRCARKDWRANLASNATIRLSAYYTNQIDQIPGVYMKVDLNGGRSASSYPVVYTLVGPSTDYAGHANDTDDMDRYLWLRRVGSSGLATYAQGSSTYGSLVDNKGAAKVVRNVTLSEGFFAGVFPPCMRSVRARTI